MAADQIVGVLLAAGRGKRFDPSGQQDKLLARLPSGIPVAVAAATNLCAALDRVVAVVRPNADELAAELRNAGCEVIICADADMGMGTVLGYAIRHCADAEAWVVALGDMPFITAATYAGVIRALCEHDLVAAECCDKRGHPVGFGRRYLPQLLGLNGELGARELLAQAAPYLVNTADPGVVSDIDTKADL